MSWSGIWTPIVGWPKLPDAYPPNIDESGQYQLRFDSRPQ